jgi:hypothetical protein
MTRRRRILRTYPAHPAQRAVTFAQDRPTGRVWYTQDATTHRRTGGPYKSLRAALLAARNR